MTYRDPFALFDVLATIGRMCDRLPAGSKMYTHYEMRSGATITGDWRSPSCLAVQSLGLGLYPLDAA